MDVCNVPRIVTACCILHNICEIHGDELNNSWLEEHSESLEQPSTTVATDNTADAIDAKVVRDKLVAFITIEN